MKRYRNQVVFLCDSVIFLMVLAFSAYFFMREQWGVWFRDTAIHLAVLYVCVMAFQIAFRTYASLWRYAESREYLTLLLAALGGFGVYEVLTRTVMETVIPFEFLTSIASLWVLGMLLLRFSYRTYRSHYRAQQGRRGIPVAIIGAGEAGVQLLQEIQKDPNCRYDVRHLFDDDPEKLHRRIHGVKILGRIDEIPHYLATSNVREVIVAIPALTEGRRQEILRMLSRQKNCHVSVLPGTLDLLEDRMIRTQLREVQIEDLLGRDVVKLDDGPVDAFLGGKTVLVTGGGGSIGSELCRQIVKHDPAHLIIVDIYENNAYDIQQELLYHNKNLHLTVEIASVRDEHRVRQLFETYKPDVVFHAAAHKHVPLMETAPQEAIRNNVFGTLNLVRAADAVGVKKFVFISTDKAVNPTSVMGASKRLCEMVLQSMKGCSATEFVAVRFGNVLGSNGSVVPLFKRQIAGGGPITITDKRIIRYFMTIPEAAQLVLQAGAMAGGNELFVLNMGQPVKILELAENLIRLSGMEPYRDIDIVETGLRPGEKLYEELLIAGRDIEATENDQIFVERQPGITADELQEKLVLLNHALEQDDPAAIRKVLHQVVPTFHEPEEVNKIQGDEVKVPEMV